MQEVKVQSEKHYPFSKPVPEASDLPFWKKWILGLDFVKVAVREAEIKAFPKAQKDVLETMADDLDKKAEELSKIKIGEMLSNVDLSKVVTIDKQKGMIFIGGVRVDDGRLTNLKAEAEFFVQSDLWGLINEGIKELSARTMFVSGETLADMQKGKSILYALSAQKNIVETFRQYVPKVQQPGVKP